MNVRKISKLRIESLKSLIHEKVSIADLDYMKSSDGFLDLDKGLSWKDIAAAMRITVEPRRANIDEKSQLLTLQVIYPDATKPVPKMYMVDGKLHTNLSSINIINPPDIDVMFKSFGWNIVWTLKGGQNMDGTIQRNQFIDVIETIDQAPHKSSTEQTTLAVLVNGSFWTKSRARAFLGFEITLTTRPFSLIDLLEVHAKDKKCIIFSDNKNPIISAGSSFYETYIKDIYDI